MKTIKNIITKVNATIDNYLPNVPNWFVWTIGLLVIYLILKYAKMFSKNVMVLRYYVDHKLDVPYKFCM